MKMVGHKEDAIWQAGDYVHLKDGKYWTAFDTGDRDGSVAVIIDRKSHVSYLLRWDEMPNGCLCSYKEEKLCIV